MHASKLFAAIAQSPSSVRMLTDRATYRLEDYPIKVVDQRQIIEIDSEQVSYVIVKVVDSCQILFENII